MYQEYTAKKNKDRLVQLEQYYEQVLEKAKAEITLSYLDAKQQIETKNKELETERQRIAELSERLMEQRRQYQKLQSMYETMRRKAISPAIYHKCSTAHKGDVSFGMCTANDILRPQGNWMGDYNRNNCVQQAEREFVLRPVHTPHNNSRIDGLQLSSLGNRLVELENQQQFMCMKQQGHKIKQ
ncbi:E3 ubiquitin-protein ligase CCNB1IP1-like isoform X1 [Tachypleus tridentatus]|uniref:E3 ubiquitin-protein ligase CCNB1IP1-like isoform X1 n=1 Tax=Tachypleus tridentatus TaxID=6853 RepID=UPI003FCF814F